MTQDMTEISTPYCTDYSLKKRDRVLIIFKISHSEIIVFNCLLRISILKLSAVFMVQLSHPYMTIGLLEKQ